MSLKHALWHRSCRCLRCGYFVEMLPLRAEKHGRYRRQRHGKCYTRHENKDVFGKRRGFLPMLPIGRVLDLLLQRLNSRLKSLVLRFQLVNVRLIGGRFRRRSCRPNLSRY